MVKQMNLDNDYLKIRKAAIIIALIVIVFGSIAYISTGIAERNNIIMYKDIYGENASIRNGASVIDNTTDNVNDNANRDEIITTVKTVLA
jgi:hypothetical protein